MVTLADDIEVKKVWDFEIRPDKFITIGDKYLQNADLRLFAKNDGFVDLLDLTEWFQYPQPFKGQIICWDDSVNY